MRGFKVFVLIMIFFFFGVTEHPQHSRLLHEQLTFSYMSS